MRHSWHSIRPSRSIHNLQSHGLAKPSLFRHWVALQMPMKPSPGPRSWVTCKLIPTANVEEGPIKAKFALVLMTLAILCAPAFGQTTAKDLVEKGNALFIESKYNESIEAFDEAIKLNPQYVEAWNNKGLALKNLGKYDEAIKAQDEPSRSIHNWQQPGTTKEMLSMSRASTMRPSRLMTRPSS